MDVRRSPSYECELGHRLNEYRCKPEDGGHRLLCPHCDVEEIRRFEEECDEGNEEEGVK
jgi:hypothetical protein